MWDRCVNSYDVVIYRSAIICVCTAGLLGEPTPRDQVRFLRLNPKMTIMTIIAGSRGGGNEHADVDGCRS